jgi:hypothetical protein
MINQMMKSMRPSLRASEDPGKVGRPPAREVRAPGTDAPARSPGFRYGAVFALSVALVVFLIVAPDADWARAVAIALEGAALVVVVATSRSRAGVRHQRAAVAGGIALAVVTAVAAGLVPDTVVFVLGGILAAAIPAALITGLMRLVGDLGVTLQAVAGALAIYLLVGLLFAWAIGFVGAVDATPFFAQGLDVADGRGVYYSFAVLTTTGFGDLTSATPVGHALAVVEMLVGQLYLVTVVGVMVGNLVARRV